MPVNHPSTDKIVILILAAGQSMRMGADNKLLLEWNGLPIVRHVAMQALLSEASSVTIVTGYQRFLIEDALSDLPVNFIHNASFEAGLASSVRQGLEYIDGRTSAVMVCLGDMPLIHSVELNQILNMYRSQQEEMICVPTFQGQQGNPIVIGRQWFGEIFSMQGDQGARKLIQAYPERVLWIDMPSDSVVFDIDTPSAFAQLCNR